jgi:GDP-mannose 6-dehydrogenase
VARISVFGLGYVGAVSVACFADRGNEVIGVDVNPVKVDMISQGRSPIIEAGLEELIQKGVTKGKIKATIDAQEAVLESEISFICVGTPSNSNGSLDLKYVKRVCEEIGTFIKKKSAYHLIVLRSTVLPGSTDEIVIPILEQFSKKKCGIGFGVCFNPEFLREGSSIKDFFNPPFTIIGSNDEEAAEIIKELYEGIKAPLIIVSFKIAEMVKYANNAFHALKVTFANEIGNICKQQDIDSHQVMDIFCLDDKLNLSSYYLKPGYAFGGSCLPKDLRALLYLSRHNDLQLPVIESILISNQQQIDMAFKMVKQTGYKKVGILGFSFKAGTDDLRESPSVELIEQLIGKGFQVKVFDQNVSLANLQGANREYIEKEIPHIASLMGSSIEEIIAESEVIVIGNKDPQFAESIQDIGENQKIIDLVRISETLDGYGENYEGLCW